MLFFCRLIAHADEPLLGDKPSVFTSSSKEALNKQDDKETVDSAKNSTNSSKKSKSVQETSIIKCNECQGSFGCVEAAQVHASQTSHTDFVEILSEESSSHVTCEESSTSQQGPQLSAVERSAKLAQLKEMLAKKRAAKEATAKDEEVQHEILRRKAGKDMSELKEQLERKELEEAMQRRKREKAEDAAHKARILAQIEADRKAKKDRDALQKQLEKGPPAAPIETDTVIKSASPALPVVQSETARLQVKLDSGKAPLKYCLPSSAPFRQFYDQVAAEAGVKKFILFTPHPHRIFGDKKSDMDATLAELELSPSASLVLQRK